MIDANSFELASAIKEKTSNCPQDCIFDDYQVTSSSTTLHLGDHDDMQMMDEERTTAVSVTPSFISFFHPFRLLSSKIILRASSNGSVRTILAILIW